MSGITRIGINERMSRVVIHGDMVFVSGQTSDDRTLNFRGQLESVLGKIDRCLAEANSDRSNLLSAQIWMKDIQKDFATLNDVWSAWLPSECAPTRATAQCEMGLAEILVEIIVTAARV